MGPRKPSPVPSLGIRTNARQTRVSAWFRPRAAETGRKTKAVELRRRPPGGSSGVFIFIFIYFRFFFLSSGSSFVLVFVCLSVYYTWNSGQRQTRVETINQNLAHGSSICKGFGDSCAPPPHYTLGVEGRGHR
ncbi:hypothetical protein LY76DRAFT_107366 [Colletotrichum caudatum]|nr:hypothetical protein LY76DRAFT_107366 [Colletotrichum caudatum]